MSSVWARALSLLLALVGGCGGSAPPAEQSTFKKDNAEQPWPPPSLGIPEGSRQAPAAAPQAGPAPPPAGGPPAAGPPAAPPQAGPLGDCKPAQQGALHLFDCSWGVALYGPGAS